MSDVTRILSAIEQGEPHAAEQLLPLIYDELRKLAAAKLAHERPGQTLDATALVHEAYLRLVPSADSKRWDSRTHFFAAAAGAPRRILIESARPKQRHKHGGGMKRHELDELDVPGPVPDDDLLSLDEALQKLTSFDAVAAQLVQLRYFAGVTISEAAELMNL